MTVCGSIGKWLYEALIAKFILRGAVPPPGPAAERARRAVVSLGAPLSASRMLEILNPIAAVRCLLDPERYGATRDEARAAVDAYIGGDEARGEKVRALLLSYTWPGGQIPFKS